MLGLLPGSNTLRQTFFLAAAAAGGPDDGLGSAAASWPAVLPPAEAGEDLEDENQPLSRPMVASLWEVATATAAADD
jgi:hypothetical protein